MRIQDPAPDSLRRRALFWLAPLLLAGTVPASADSEWRRIALLDEDVAQVVEECRWLFSETWEEAGEFGGYGGGAMEVGHMALDLASLQDLAAETLASQIDTSTRSARLDFAGSDAGQKFAWLSRELASRDGRSDLLRQGDKVHARLSPERLAELESIDRAMLESATAGILADEYFALVEKAAAQIESLVDEPVEWLDPRSEVQTRLRENAARRAFVRLSYRLSRLDEVELARLLEWTESPQGQAFHSARQAALLQVADEVSRRFLAAQAVAIDRELAEYRRENEDEQENEDDEDGS